MKRNGMCPICYLKKLFTRPSRVTDLYSDVEYDNGAAQTPPMGWSSWNTFKNNIDEDLIYETAVAMKEKGLADAGYRNINIDDCWHSSLRDENGEISHDLTRFAHGMSALVEKINALGLKAGIYSSNGTLTCEDLPASLGNEYKDALTFARWGFEYLKYDFCHNEPISRYAPIVYGIEIAKLGEKEGKFYPCTDGKVSGLAKFMPDKELPCGYKVSGMDACRGALEYNNVYAEEDGKYALTVCVRKKGLYEKALMVQVNGERDYMLDIPKQKFWNVTARFQTVVDLKKGVNTVKMFNPIGSRADSAMLQYRKMGAAVRAAAEKVAAERGAEVKPITFSICEWGFNQPYKWGASAGNLWRTTPDINPSWRWIKLIYEHNVKLYKYASPGHWNDPDMLEVGNGGLSRERNKSHFALWCMMAAPLVLGNDIRNITDEVLALVTDKDLIAIDQDRLGKQAKRLRRGLAVDVLARPLEGGRAAVCFFNRNGVFSAKASLDISALAKDEYVAFGKKGACRYREVFSGETGEGSRLSCKLGPDESKVFIIE